MLTKSAAKTFFLVGTGLCSVSFLLLTADTLARIPEQTNEHALSPQVERGKHLWEANNCMGCHTLFGEGAYYAPELTRVYDRRGPDFIRAMLRDPASMYPGQRRMQQYDFDDEEIESLVAFLQWCNDVDLNGFPPAPVLGGGATATASAGGSGAAPHDPNRPRVFDQMCVACHSVEGRGGSVGPALDGVGDRFDTEYLDRWLHDPQAIKQGTTMPRLPLSDEQIGELTAFLATLRAQAPEPDPAAADTPAPTEALDAPAAGAPAEAAEPSSEEETR